MVAGMLARFSGVKYDASRYKGNYSPRKVNPRDIPSDSAIAEYFHKIKNPAWRWVYGLIATYGLRPHEAFFVDFDRLRDGEPILYIKEGKTGERFVWPFHPEWFDEFRLKGVKLPNVNLDRPRDKVGHSATRYFWELGSPFPLMNLRHAWAIRTLEYGLENTFSAQQMGHSVDVHEEVYQHWITLKVHQRAYERVLLRDDRPKPPPKN